MAEQNQKNGLGVAGFVVALIGVILSWIPFINVFGVILCGVGLILSLIAVFKKPRGLAIVGIILALAGGGLYYWSWMRALKIAAEAAAAALS